MPASRSSRVRVIVGDRGRVLVQIR
jgi:hypothetical protein